MLMTFLVTFHTHFDANVFVKKAKTFGVAKMRPVPRKLSSSCGTCVEFPPKDDSFDFRSLQDMEYESFYLVKEEGFELLHHKE